MTDVASVVAALQQKSVGKLKYSNSSDNLDFDVPSSLNSSIDISPSLVLKAEGTSSSFRFKNYYSPDRSFKNNDSFHSCEENTPKQINKVTPPSVSMKPNFFEDVHLYCKSEKEKKQLDHSFDQMIVSVSDQRLQKMKHAFTEIDAQYDNSMELINKRNNERLAASRNQLRMHEANLLKYSDQEIEDFQQLIYEKSEESSLRMNQIESIRTDLEKKKENIEQQKQLKRQQSEKLQSIAENGKNIVMEASEILKKLNENGYENMNHIKNFLDEILNCYSQAIASIKEGLDAKNNLNEYINGSQSKIQHMQSLKEKMLYELKLFKQKIEEQIKLNEQKRKEEEEAKIREEKAKQNNTATPQETSIPKSVITTAPSNVKSNNANQNSVNQISNTSISAIIPELGAAESSLKPILPDFTSIPAFMSYLKLRKLLSDTETNIVSLNKSTVKEKKAYKFDLYKVVNTCINAISDESPAHLLDKITKLNNLLSGNRVAMGSKSISANDDPCAVLLCKDLLARKLVSQGISQVSSSFKAAFPIAAVCVSLWSLHSDCGDLMLAHFYKECPFLVPFYLPKVKEFTTEQYFSFIGFDVKDGKIDEEDKFLKKLSGLVRLYTAIFCSSVPPQLGNRNHPHGLDFAWTWFTRLLNLDPLPVYTANILYDFLDVAGYFLMQRYGKQFQKLLVYVCKFYVPKIVQVTPASSKASASRLKLFLETCIKEKKFKIPEGHLSMHWWKR